MRLLLSFLTSTVLLAQAPPPDSPKIQDIRRFFRVTNVGELAFADIRRNCELQKRANPDIPTEFWTELLKALKPGEFVERMVPIYDKHFSHEDIKAWNVFFETGPGQVFLKNQMVVLEESMIAGQSYVQEVGGPILQRLRKK